MPWRAPSGQEADQIWISFRPVASSLHLLVTLQGIAVLVKDQPLRLLTLAICATHVVSLICCRRQIHHGNNETRRLRIVASLMAVVGWALRTYVNYRFSIQQPAITEYAIQAWSSGLAYVLEVLISAVEQVQALLLLPGVVVAAWLALHLHFIYEALDVVRPGPAGTFVWALVQLSLPHLLHVYLSKPCQTPAAVCIKAVTPAGTSHGVKDLSRGAGSKEGLDSKLEQCLATSSEAAAGHAGSKAGNGGHQHATPTTDSPSIASADASIGPGGLVKHAIAEEPGGGARRSSLPVLKALASSRAKAIAGHSAKAHMYVSPLLHSQVVIIKLEQHDPEQLRANAISAINNMLSQTRSGLVVSHACVRKGCTLVCLDLISLHRAPDTPEQAPLLGSDPYPLVQAWLQSLLSPDTAIPDGAVAYISVGAQHFKATWQQEQGSWVVTQEPPTAAGLPSGGLSLLYVDAPVARLPAQAASSRGPSLLHRVSLLLQSTYAGRTLSFKGSDQTSAPPEQPAGGDALVISCIARGSWGTCLPVTVAGVEQDTEEQQGMETAGDCSSPLTALTLDVDLSQAPHGGVVQLELWCGRSLLASAPLLLLPPLAPAGANTSDALLEELLQHTKLIKWSEEEGGSGIAAWLADLGQVLHTAEHVSAVALATGAEHHAQSSAGSSAADWGGVVSGLAEAHASSPALLSSVLALGEGVLEHAKSEGLRYTSALVVSSILRVQQRLEVVKAGSGPASLPYNCLSITASSATTSSSTNTNTSKSRSRSSDAHSTGISNTCAPEGAKGVTAGSAHVSLSPAGGQAHSSSSLPKANELRQRHRQPGVTKEHNSEEAAGGQQPGWSMNPNAGLREHVKFALLGFQPRSLDQQYALSIAQQSNSIVLLHSLLISLWVCTSTLKSAMQGWGPFLEQLPIHILCGAPKVLSAVLALHQRHSWFETAFVVHSLGRTLATCGAAMGLPMPQSYSAMCKIRLNIWGELVHLFGEPMRVPALVCSHAILAAFDLALLTICGHKGRSAVAQAIAARVFILALGVALDIGRRRVFLRKSSAGKAVPASPFWKK